MTTKKKDKAETVLALRTCDKDRKSYGGFQWPESGVVTAPDWRPTAECGNGLHALENGEGEWGHLDFCLDAKCCIVETEKEKRIDLGGKIKFETCVIIEWLSLPKALAKLLCNADRIIASVKEVFDGAPKVEDIKKAASGDASQLAASGYASKLAASGDDSVAVASGNRSKIKVGKNGALAISWHDGERNRIAVGYVGENGIKADTWYHVVDGKLRETKE